MSNLNKILNELCAHVKADPPDLPSMWSKQTVNFIRNAARQGYLDQEAESGVRNDYVDDYGDIRYGDPGQNNHGMDAYHDAEDVIGYANEFEEEQEDFEGMGEEDLQQELLSTIKELLGHLNSKSEEEEEDEPADELDDDINDMVDDTYDEDGSEMDGEQFGDDETEEWDDPDYQGVIRTIPDAHLVYKRQQEDGTFNELWQYNIGKDFRKELETRRAILAGTDIPVTKMASPDNNQTYELWTAGNCQLLNIRGLPN